MVDTAGQTVSSSQVWCVVVHGSMWPGVLGKCPTEPGRAMIAVLAKVPLSLHQALSWQRWLSSTSWNLQSPPDTQTHRTCAPDLLITIMWNIICHDANFCAKIVIHCSKLFQIKMKKIFGINLLRPLLYVMGLCFVFLFLLSSADVRVSWLVPDIIDKVGEVGEEDVAGKNTVDCSQPSEPEQESKSRMFIFISRVYSLLTDKKSQFCSSHIR